MKISRIIKECLLIKTELLFRFNSIALFYDVMPNFGIFYSPRGVWGQWLN